MDKRAVIIGATSSLAVILARKLAKEGYDLILVARNIEETKLIANDLSVRYGNKNKYIRADFISDNFCVNSLINDIGDIDKAFIIAGDMGSNEQDDIINIEKTVNINFTIPAQILTLLAKNMEIIDGGDIAVISSVAGDRGRQSNYPYGSAKAGIAVFSAGIRNRYSNSNVHIMTVKPGFIDTPMTYSMNSPLIASREYVADKIIEALDKKKDIIYVPFFWRYIMLIIMHIPEFIFKKLKL